MDEIDWLMKQRRRGALRMIAIGGLFAIAAAIWLALYWDYDYTGATPFTRTRLVGATIGAIGAALVVAGAAMAARARATRLADDA